MLKLTSLDLKKDKVETLAIAVCEDKSIYTDAALNAVIKRAKRLKEFSGKKEQVLMLYEPAGIKVKRALLIGLGEHKEIEAEAIRSMAGNTVKTCIKKKIENLWFALPDFEKIKLDTQVTLEAMLEGAYLGNHVFNKYKGDKKEKALKRIYFIAAPATVTGFRRLPSRVATICRSTTLAREWISTPSNDKTPEKLARSMVNLARKAGLKIQVLKEGQLKQQKFGAMLSVSAGSQSKPSLLILEHKPKGAKKTIALIGKGVTFDSGGLNIKTSGSMSDMKSDMSGAAAVAATLIALAGLKPRLNVIGAIPLVENMPSGRATRPGDIVRSYAGKTIEIGNTDAEGRLILIDAMAYVQKKYRPQTMIDLATLTGACVVALGEKIAAVFSNDVELAASLVKAGEKTHERCWHMPLPDDYKELLKSDFADMNNISSTRWGGAITAALFLSEFAGDTKWAHIDIAGPAYSKKGDAYCGPGGTGFGVRLLCDFIAGM